MRGRGQGDIAERRYWVSSSWTLDISYGVHLGYQYHQITGIVPCDTVCPSSVIHQGAL